MSVSTLKWKFARKQPKVFPLNGTVRLVLEVHSRRHKRLSITVFTGYSPEVLSTWQSQQNITMQFSQVLSWLRNRILRFPGRACCHSLTPDAANFFLYRSSRTSFAYHPCPGCFRAFLIFPTMTGSLFRVCIHLVSEVVTC